MHMQGVSSEAVLTAVVGLPVLYKSSYGIVIVIARIKLIMTHGMGSLLQHTRRGLYCAQYGQLVGVVD